MASPSSSTSSTIAVDLPEDTDPGVTGQPSKVSDLPEKPTYRPPYNTYPKPRSICRNYVFRGHCWDMRCPRAHVRHKAMLDLIDYLLEREDCPEELHSVREQCNPPLAGKMNRRLRRSDRICREFLENDGKCRWWNRCFHAHIRSIYIYNSLLPPKILTADEQAVDELSQATDCKTSDSEAPLTPADDEQPVAESPESTDRIAREPLLADNTSPRPANVQHPPASSLNREHTVSKSGILKAPQSPVAGAVSQSTVRPSKPAKPPQSPVADAISRSTVRLAKSQQESTAGSPITDWQKKVHFESVRHSVPPDVSEGSPTSPDSNDAIDGDPIVDDRSDGQQDNVQTTMDTLSLSEDRLDPSVCRNWYNGRCHRRRCKYWHSLTPPQTESQKTIPHDPAAVQTIAHESHGAEGAADSTG